MKVTLVNEVGAMKNCKVGFSWTTFFFCAWVPIFRGDWKMLFIMLVTSGITFGLGLIVFPFIYNKLYIKSLLEKGYAPATEEDRTILEDKKFLMKSVNTVISA